MKYFTIGLLLASALILSCEKEESKRVYIHSAEDAKELISEWIFEDYNPDMNPSLTYSLDEFTNDEVYQRLNSQIFSINCDVPGLDQKWVLICDEKVYDLHPDYQYASNTDLRNIMVTDLNKDSKYELFYTAHGGSGILYQGVSCFHFVNDATSQQQSTVIASLPLNYELILQKENDQKLVLIFKSDVFNQRIGELQITEVKEILELKVNYDADIPQEIIDLLNGKG